jgi:GT2 family glycosyltransferase
MTVTVVTPNEGALTTSDVWAVVVNWNGGERVVACLASLVEAGVQADHIVLVDNASTDGSLERATEAHPRTIVLCNDANLGFGGGANQGARLALNQGAPMVMWINDDVTLPAETLPQLVDALTANPKWGMVGPRVVYPGEPVRIWAAGGELDWTHNLSTLVGHGRLDEPRMQVTRDVDYIPGCALLARRACLDEVGLFEESYFAYMEDVELGLRVRSKDWGVVVVGEVHAVHDASASTGGGYTARRKYMQALNSVRFLREHGTGERWMRFAAFDVLTLPFLFVVGLVTGRARAVLAKGLGLWHGARGRVVTAASLEPGGTRLW